MLIDTEGRSRTSAGLDSSCEAFLGALKKRGMREEDRVVVSATNSVEFVVALFALMEFGVSLALVDPRVPAADLARMAEEAGARWLLTDRGESVPGTRAVPISLAGLAAGAALERKTGGQVAAAPPLGFAKWFAREDALVVWSSGSTGTPKGIVRSGASVRGNTARTAARMEYRPEDVLLPLLPFTHQYGLSILLLWKWAGATLVVQPSTRRVDLAASAVREHGVTVVDTVPTMYHTLLNLLDSDRADARDLASVRMWCVGGEPLTHELATRFRTRLGRPLLDGYGSSEAGNIALAVGSEPVGCGRALDGVEVRVVDEAGRPVPAGTVGEVLVRTPDYMTGLLGPGGTVLPVDGTGYRTDDIGRLDRAGNLTVLGRRAAVHRHGHTLYPDGIADRASACGAPVQVIPVEEGRNGGAELVFFLVDELGRPPAYWRPLITALVAEHEWPNRIVVLPAFPLNNTGKVDRKFLQQTAGNVTVRVGRKGVLQ